MIERGVHRNAVVSALQGDGPATAQKSAKAASEGEAEGRRPRAKLRDDSVDDRKHTPKAAAWIGSGGDGFPMMSPVPGEQLVEPADGMVGDAGEDVGQPCLRIDVIEAAGLNQRIRDRRPLTTTI